MAKPAYKSKSIQVALVTIALSRLWPGFPKLVAENPEVYIVLQALIQMGLRLVTKGPVRMRKSRVITVGAVLTLALVGCSSVQQQLEPGVFYKRDIGIEVNGGNYEGVVVIPKAARYNLVLKPKGSMDLILVRTCHREFTGEKVSSGFLGIGKGQFKYEYNPLPGLEEGRVCPMRVDVYESDKGRQSWAFLDFEDPAYSLKYLLACNGISKDVNGVGVCQTKAGLAQRLDFPDPVRFAPPEPVGCAVPLKRGSTYEFKASYGECLYHFDTEDGRMGRLTTIGYDGVLVRSPQ